MSEYYKKIKGYDVWGTVIKPMIENSNSSGFIQSSQFCAAFKFGDRPRMSDGEYIKDATERTEGHVSPFFT